MKFRQITSYAIAGIGRRKTKWMPKRLMEIDGTNRTKSLRSHDGEHYAFLKNELKTFRAMLLVHADQVPSPV
jgi:hypothetical protein